MFQKLDRYILLCIIILMSLRFIIAGFLPGADRFILICTFVVLLFYSVPGLKNALKEINLFLIVYLASFASFLVYLICYFTMATSKLIFLNFVIERSFSTIIASIVIFLAYTKCSRQSLVWVLDVSSTVLTIVGGAILVLNGLFVTLLKDYFRAEDIAVFVFRFEKQIINQRIVGMLINLENSGVLLLMALIYFIHRFIASRIKLNKMPSLNSVLISFLGLIGIFATMSLMIVGTAGFLLAVIFSQISIVSFAKKLSFKIKFFVSITIFTFIVLAKSYFDAFLDRFFYYFAEPQQLFSRISLDTGKNLFDFFLNTNINELMGSGFGINEVHVLLSFSYVGLIPSLCWYLVFFSPVFFAFNYKKLNQIEQSVFFMIFSGFVSSLHYAGVTAWPNNILYFLCFNMLYSRICKVQVGQSLETQ